MRTTHCILSGLLWTCKPAGGQRHSIDWADPYAKRYLVSIDWFESASRSRCGILGHVSRRCHHGRQGGKITLQLSRNPLPVRWMRIWMTESSKPATRILSGSSQLPGLRVRNFTSERQPRTANSTTLFDTADRAQSNVLFLCRSVAETRSSRSRCRQFDLFYTSGITRGLPAMIPVAMLYETLRFRGQLKYLKAEAINLVYRDGRGAYSNTLCRRITERCTQWATALHKADQLEVGRTGGEA
jgi:hypothetical protein